MEWGRPRNAMPPQPLNLIDVGIMKYICNTFGKFEYCKKCKHGKPHDRFFGPFADACTNGRDCEVDEKVIKVRCVEKEK